MMEGHSVRADFPGAREVTQTVPQRKIYLSLKAENFTDMGTDDIKRLLARYCVATLGLVLVALGVAFSIKSDIGTAPVSCPPYVANLFDGRFTVGEYNMMMHGIFILAQVLMLRRRFRLSYLMQIPAAVVFGLLIDGAMLLVGPLEISSYLWKMIFCILCVLCTAAGVSLEVLGGAWMLAGEQTVSAISEVSGLKFRHAKIGFDFFLVAISALFSLIVFSNPLGGHGHVLIREGTLILALFTGVCMKVTDSLSAKLFSGFIRKYGKDA